VINFLDQIDKNNIKLIKKIKKDYHISDRDIFKINAFTNNYYVRTLLGKQLGNDPIYVKSNQINDMHLEKAKQILMHFDFIITDMIWNTTCFSNVIKYHFGIKNAQFPEKNISPWVNIDEKEDLFLKENKFPYNFSIFDFKKRNEYDIKLFEFINNMVTKDCNILKEL